MMFSPRLSLYLSLAIVLVALVGCGKKEGQKVSSTESNNQPTEPSSTPEQSTRPKSNDLPDVPDIPKLPDTLPHPPGPDTLPVIPKMPQQPPGPIIPTIPNPVLPGQPNPVLPGQPNPGENSKPPGQNEPMTPVQPEPGAKTDPDKKEPEKPKWITDFEGKKLEDILKMIETDPDPVVRESMILILPQFGPTVCKPAIGPLINVLRNFPDPSVKIAAIVALSNMALYLEGQVNKADDEAEKKRSQLIKKDAILALHAIGNRTFSGSIVRRYCVQALGAFGPASAIQMSNFKAWMTDSSWQTRQIVARTLGQIGAPASTRNVDKPNDSAMSNLVIMLRDPAAVVRMEAIQALLGIGPPKISDAAKYIEAVKKYLEPVEKRVAEEKDESILAWLLVLNIMYDDRRLKENLERLGGIIENSDERTRLSALNALKAMGPKGLPAIRSVLAALTYDNIVIQNEAISVLAHMGPVADEALVDLMKIKETHKEDFIKYYAGLSIDIIQKKKDINEFYKPYVPPKKPEKPAAQ